MKRFAKDRATLPLLLVLGISVYACGADGDAPAVLAPRFTSTSEVRFKATAEKTVRPVCPDRYNGASPAVGVAYVSVGMSGRVLAVKALESPTLEASESMITALRQWRFQPLTHLEGHPEIFSGKVTFYFVSHDGQCDVKYPNEVDYVGRKALNSRRGDAL